jgi:hypothetical protein
VHAEFYSSPTTLALLLPTRPRSLLMPMESGNFRDAFWFFASLIFLQQFVYPYVLVHLLLLCRTFPTLFYFQSTHPSISNAHRANLPPLLSSPPPPPNSINTSHPQTLNHFLTQAYSTPSVTGDLCIPTSADISTIAYNTVPPIQSFRSHFLNWTLDALNDFVESHVASAD